MQLANPIRRWRRLGFYSLLCLAVSGTAISQTSTSPSKPAQTSAAPAKKSQHHITGHTTAKRAPHTAKSSRSKKGSRKRGQQVIDSQRAREIQQALIREHYLEGEPSGKWDAATQAAMQRYQADQGWQSKTTPDSRALIKLGLGLSPDQLLNPESAMTTTPAPPDPKAPIKQDTSPPQP
jgi:Putative peptidoglycan binding domain